MVDLAALLSQGLDLSLRARRLGQQDEAAAIAANRGGFRDCAMSRSGTVPQWAWDQYERDLADWERCARQALASPMQASSREEGLNG